MMYKKTDKQQFDKAWKNDIFFYYNPMIQIK